MPVEIQIKKLYDWALLPEKPRVDRIAAATESDFLQQHFRFHRKFRYPEICPPWVLGQEWGWHILSPISLNLTPLDDVQVAADAQPEAAGRVLSVTEFWNRGEGYIAMRNNNWIKSFQYRNRGGAWEAMFLPNGAGTVEWHLGWAMKLPEEYLLLVTSLDDQGGLQVPTGMMTARQVNSTWDSTGISVAIRPLEQTRIERGQPFCRIAVVHRSCLQAKLQVVEPT
ncbi:hypothetical protein IU486_31360 [Streptomyces gardneri]|uniref:hypothetical protein n=1 Tax=Nocardia abscessus TaxID=120957 RepID=UPI0018961CBB|nr:hypothetical protein [Nocardia abscessus]MBF6169202.1 hypothetical protein [Streptomyces gardneri]MBF6475287.1 hypothetical protein [Nocardia abscessus]